jgi:hypothetical protein
MVGDRVAIEVVAVTETTASTIETHRILLICSRYAGGATSV